MLRRIVKYILRLVLERHHRVPRFQRGGEAAESRSGRATQQDQKLRNRCAGRRMFLGHTGGV